MGEQNRLSGEELKNLMIDGVLLDEYINEENLNTLLDCELEQMGDNEYYDMSVILYCSDLIAKNYADESYEKVKQEAYKKVKEKIKSSSSKPKERFRFKYAFVGGIVSIFVLWFGFEAVSVTSFNNNFFDGTAYLSKTIVTMLTGNVIQQDDTERLALGSKIYKTIEQLEKAEKIDIIIPMWLPDDIEVEDILYDKGETNQIHIQYKDGVALLIIVLNSTIPIDRTNGAEIYENNDVKYYVFMNSNIIWWEYNNDFYSLDCGFDIAEYAEEIIKNIK